MGRFLIFVNGVLPQREAALQLLRPNDFLLAADGGTQLAWQLGVRPQVVIGDLDSLDDDLRQHLTAAGVQFLVYPREKDETDLELALQYALGQGATSILIVGALGGRLDQTLANLSLLTDPRLSDLDVRLDDGVEEAFFVRRYGEVRGRPGETVSLLPWGAPVTGIRTQGLRWALQSETLYPERTRGVSNELLAETACIEVESGLLLVVHRRLL